MESSGAKIACWRRTAQRWCAISMSRAVRPPYRFRRSRRLRWSVLAAALLLASCEPAGVLDPQGPIASAERLLLINSTAIMLVVVIPVIVATLAFAWWYRASNTPPRWQDATRKAAPTTDQRSRRDRRKRHCRPAALLIDIAHERRAVRRQSAILAPNDSIRCLVTTILPILDTREHRRELQLSQ